MLNPVLAARQQKRQQDQLRTSFAEYDGKLIIAQSQDCTPIAEYAKQQQAIGNVGSADMRHAAKIPNVIIEKYCNEHGVTFAEVMRNPVHMKRICNDPANAAFRIWKGKL
jgi:deoxyribodipyrimidine photolyase